MQLFWSTLEISCEYLLGKEEDKNEDNFTTFPDDTFLVTHATRKSHFVIIKNDREIPEDPPLIKIKEAAEILIRTMEWSSFPTVFVYAKLREIRLNRDFCLANTDRWANLLVRSSTAKMWNSLSSLEKIAKKKKPYKPTTKVGNLKRSSLSNYEEKSSGSLITTNLTLLDSMLMMQPSPEKKIKEEVEEPLEKVIKIENDINERVKIENEQEKAVPVQNFGSTVISDGELKEVKTEPINENEFEVKPPLLEPEIMTKQQQNEESTSDNLLIQRLYKRKCSVCLSSEKYQSLNHVTDLTEKMIVLLGMVIGGILSIPGAICKYTEGIDTYICRRHFYESRHYLFDLLGATSSDEICNTERTSMKTILDIVELIQDGPMTAVQFVRAFEKFAEKDLSAELKKNKKEESRRTNRMFVRKCCYCQKVCKQSELVGVPKSEDIRLEWIRLLGADFEKNVRSVKWPFICRAHLPPNSFGSCGRLLKQSASMYRG